MYGKSDAFAKVLLLLRLVGVDAGGIGCSSCCTARLLCKARFAVPGNTSRAMISSEKRVCEAEAFMTPKGLLRPAKLA